MSLSLADREKLLRTAQSGFPLAKQWKKLKKDIKENHPNGKQRKQIIGISLASAFGAVLGVCALNMGVAAVGFFALVLAVCGSALAFVGTYMSVEETCWAWKLQKDLKNKAHHQSIRHYIVQKTALRHFKQSLPQLSDRDLEVIVQLPNLSNDCKKMLEQELAHRAHEQITHDLTQMFLDPTVEVETPSFNNSNPILAKSLTV